jgi:low affinity Fe/Cu permease
MIKNVISHTRKGLEKLASGASSVVGSNGALICALLFIITWAAAGPLMHFSSNWQLTINTGTSVITFLMVFLIQKAQNKDALAIQIKLNELITSNKMASNMLVNVEDLSEEELKVLNKYYSKVAEKTRNDPAQKSAHESKIEEVKAEK